MGVAAYNRGSANISRFIEREHADLHPVEFEIMDNLNAMTKDAGALAPFGPVVFSFERGLCWASCPVSGFGYHYRSLREAVRAWRVVVTGCDVSTGEYLAIPLKSGA